VESASLVVGDVPAVASGARRYRLDCAHGSTSVLLLPGRSPIGDVVAVEMLVLRHCRTTGCQCASTMPEPVFGPALTQVAV
jgi:hypothetical protein